LSGVLSDEEMAIAVKVSAEANSLDEFKRGFTIAVAESM
jgi:hypothetical protein